MRAKFEAEKFEYVRSKWTASIQLQPRWSNSFSANQNKVWEFAEFSLEPFWLKNRFFLG